MPIRNNSWFFIIIIPGGLSLRMVFVVDLVSPFIDEILLLTSLGMGKRNAPPPNFKYLFKNHLNPIPSVTASD